MKTIKIILVSILLTCFCGNSFALDTANVSGLTEKQKAEIDLQIAKLKEAKNASVIDKIKAVDDWSKMGENMGKAIAGAAKEVGVAADELLQTDVGKITVILIAWKVAGKDMLELTHRIVGYIAGAGLLLVFIPIWLYIFRRICISTIVREEIPEKGFRSIKHFEPFDTSKDSVQGTRLIMGLFLVCGIMFSTWIMFG